MEISFRAVKVSYLNFKVILSKFALPNDYTGVNLTGSENKKVKSKFCLRSLNMYATILSMVLLIIF